MGEVEKEIRLIDHFEDIAQNSYKVEFKKKRANRKLEALKVGKLSLRASALHPQQRYS